MRIFLSKPFQKFARKEEISDDAMLEAIERAERGLIDADLGGGVIKQRIPRPGEGRSGGYRSIILYRGDQKAFFVYGFSKNQQENISIDDLKGYREFPTQMLELSDDLLQKAVEKEIWRE